MAKTKKEATQTVAKTNQKVDLDLKMPSVQQLLEAGAHFGHEVRKWNPKMAQYIFTQRNGIHVIDLEKTEKMLGEALKFLYDQAADGKKILFVATKRQAQEIVKAAAEKAASPYMVTRWVGGLLTNFDHVNGSIKSLNDLKSKKASGQLSDFTKKEQLLIDRKIAKLEANFGGVKEMNSLPQVVFVLDAKKELNTVREANKMGLPVVAVVDTNSDPSIVDYPIPANDDAIKAIEIILGTIAEAIAEGNKLAEKKTKEKAELENQEASIQNQG